jgi:predicted lipoprotein with Yx(FWY)xxD motif
LITSVLSDKNGDFCLELPEGKYSIMVREEGKGLWANIFDGEKTYFLLR